MHMRPFVTSSFRWLLAPVVAGFALTAEAQRPSGSRADAGIQFTEPTSASTTTNKGKATESLADMLGLEPGVRKPFEVFNANDSFSGARMLPPMRRPPPSAAETRRMKEALDRKKNWSFLTPQEIYGVQTPDEMMQLTEFGKDGAVVEPKTSLERYLERMEKARTPVVTKHPDSDILSQHGVDGEITGDLKEEKPVLSFLAEPGSKKPVVMPVGLGLGMNPPLINPGLPLEKSPGTLFGPPAPAVDPFAKSPAQEATMKEYKEMLESRSSVSSFNTGFGVSAPSALTPAFSLGGPSPNSLGAQPAPRSPLTTPATLGVAVPSYTPAYSPAPTPLIAPPPAPAPRMKPPTFEVPARKF
jgi:hypothetical protein